MGPGTLRRSLLLIALVISRSWTGPSTKHLVSLCQKYTMLSSTIITNFVDLSLGSRMYFNFPLFLPPQIGIGVLGKDKEHACRPN